MRGGVRTREAAVQVNPLGQRGGAACRTGDAAFGGARDAADQAGDVVDGAGLNQADVLAERCHLDSGALPRPTMAANGAQAQRRRLDLHACPRAPVTYLGLQRPVWPL